MATIKIDIPVNNASSASILDKNYPNNLMYFLSKINLANKRINSYRDKIKMPTSG